ncbi:MAG: DUF4236 domain-containing protein [Gaiellaceae bacterium]
MGSFRFRRTVKIAPGLRLNINKKSVGLSAGTGGVRYSINSSGRRTTSVGLPGTGLSYQHRSGGRRRAQTGLLLADEATVIPSPTRVLASAVGWLTFLVFALGILNGSPHSAGTIAGIGVVVYVVLRVARPILDPLIVWLLMRRRPADVG